MFDDNKINYNFVFIFASPPHCILKKTISTICKTDFPKLSNEKEFKMIENSVKKANVEIKVTKMLGTKKSLINLFKDERPGALHFSGHGVTRQFIKE